MAPIGGQLSDNRPSYPQKWAAYNAAQVSEKVTFQRLLRDLCASAPLLRERSQTRKIGRPPLPIADAIFAATYKVYSTLSARRFMCDLSNAKDEGLISQLPHYNTVLNVLSCGEYEPLFRDLIERSAMPLKEIETTFAVDSSGFSVCRFDRWFEHNYGGKNGKKGQSDWVKIHIMCGVITNIVTAVEIAGRNASDLKMLPPLLRTTIQHFSVSELVADKAYSGREILELVSDVGATPYIPFVKTATGVGGGAWSKMYHLFSANKEEFLAHYHKRSNVESTFSMMKKLFGDSLRSRKDESMKNEALCKILCHNIVVLIHEIHERGIAPLFMNSKEAS